MHIMSSNGLFTCKVKQGKTNKSEIKSWPKGEREREREREKASILSTYIVYLIHTVSVASLLLLNDLVELVWVGFMKLPSPSAPNPALSAQRVGKTVP